MLLLCFIIHAVLIPGLCRAQEAAANEDLQGPKELGETTAITTDPDSGLSQDELRKAQAAVNEDLQGPDEWVECTDITTDTSSGLSQRQLKKAQEYIDQFYGNARWKGKRLNPTEEKIKAMQTFFNLKVTGKINEETMRVIQKPRCGVSDVLRYSSFPGRPKWEKTTITYRIVNGSPEIGTLEVDFAVKQAFRIWGEVTRLNFLQVYSGIADIMISFDLTGHGDLFPFDGRKGVFAHAFAPSEEIGGDIHFDDDEEWTLTGEGTNIFLVAVHEVGHTLGLEHSKDERSIMYPLLNNNNVDPRNFKLYSKDIAAIKALYGAKATNSNPSPTKTPQPKPNPTGIPEPIPTTQSSFQARCDPTMRFDAVTSMRRDLLFFKNEVFWRKSTRSNTVDTYTFDEFWPNLRRVDAAYEFAARDVVYLFKGRQYWATSGLKMLWGYPRSITNFGFPSSVKKIDAAVFLKDEKKVIFFVDDKYWSFDHSKNRMEPKSPKKIKDGFPGIGTKVESAFQSGDYLYFSDGASQIEYDPRGKSVLRKIPNYKWLNCDDMILQG